MPNPRCGPRGAIACEVDASQWAGVDLFTRGASTITAPSTWATFGDALELLNGRGCGATLSGAGTAPIDLAAAAATATGTACTATITADDRVQLTFTGATPVVLSAATAPYPWGFDQAGQTSVASGGDQVLTAVGEWTRGNIDADTGGGAQLFLTRGASSGVAPATAAWAHSVPQTVRRWGIADADDTAPTSSLSYLDDGASWGVTADGLVWWSAAPAAASPVWASTTFRDALGFTGDEVAVVTAGVSATMTATYPCRWLLTPSRPLEAVIRGRTWAGSAVQASDRSAYSVEWMQADTFDVRGYLDGPADRIDRQDHWLRSVLPYAYPGARINVYQDWGDGRRGRRTATTAPTASGSLVLPYSVLYTAQRDGEYGRWLCRRSVDDPTSYTAEWPSRMRRRVPLAMSLTNYEGDQ